MIAIIMCVLSGVVAYRIGFRSGGVSCAKHLARYLIWEYHSLSVQRHITRAMLERVKGTAG